MTLCINNACALCLSSLFFFLLLAGSLLLPISATANGQPYSELLTQAGQLHAANSEAEARAVIARLAAANSQLLGVPCEDLHCRKPPAEVHAATLDVLLLQLANVSKRWPELSHPIGTLLLSWNYCDIRYRNRSHDLKRTAHRIVRSTASQPSPAAGLGWQSWGFSEQDEGRLIPAPMQHFATNHRAHANFIFRYSRQHCFPDPGNGQTPYDITEPMYPTPVHPHGALPISIPSYPYTWQWQRATSLKPDQQQSAPPVNSGEGHSLLTIPPSGIHKQQPVRTARSASVSHPRVSHKPSARPPSWTPQVSDPVGKAEPMHAARRLLSPPASNVEDGEAADSGKASAPKTKSHPPSSPAGRGQSHIAPPSASHKKETVIQGSFYNKWRMGSNQLEIGISALWNPFSYAYLQGSVSMPLPARGSNPGYTWGFGYNDWHPGGWFIEFNQWLPWQLGRGGNLAQAEFNGGYRIPYPEAWQGWLNSTVNVKMTAKTTSLGCTSRLSHRDYFVRLGLSKSMRGFNSGWQWIYGFGHWNWQAGSFNLEYANWGPNPAFQHNFRRNGELIIEYRLEY